MKKFLSFILVMAMVLSVSGVAMAAGIADAEALQNAINAAADNTPTTITLTGDITIAPDASGIVIPAKKNITLDLAGYTISQEKACTASYQMITVASNSSLTITGNGKLSFKDTSAGDPSFGWGSYTIHNSGTLVVENGTIEHLGEQNPGGGQPNVHMYCAIFQYSGSTTINGGTISTPTYRSARLWSGKMTINGGSFEGQLWVQCVNDNADLTITGGTFAPRGNDGSSVFVSNASNNAALKITGGDFTTKIGCSDTSKLTGGKVTGGTFAVPPAEGMLADNFIVQAGTDGKVKVVEESLAAPVAKVNGIEYTDIQEAIKAAANGGTVEVLSDVVVPEWIMFSEKLSLAGKIITIDSIKVTINGNGKTLYIYGVESGGNGGYLFYDATELNIKDLTIKYADGVGGGICFTSGKIEKVTFDGGTNSILPGDGDITIEGCTFKSNGTAIYYEDERDNLVVTGNIFDTAEGAYAIMLRGGTDFTDNIVNTGKVNVVGNATGEISGNDFGDERFKVYNDATATITGNTINNLVFDEPNAPTAATFTGNTMSPDAETALDAVTPKYTVNVVASPTDAGTVDGGGTYKKGDTVNVTANAAAGYTFVAWTENGYKVSTDEIFTFTVVDGDRDLVAVFEETEDTTVSYTIRFDANGGTGSVDDITLTAASADESVRFTFPANGFTYEGHTFTGWCVNKDGNNIVHQPGETALTSTSLVFYAQWEEVEEEPEEPEDPKPTKPDRKDIKVKYEGGNRFSTNKSAVPTSVEIDGVPVSFVGDGRSFTVSCIEPGNHWITVRWHSTSVTTNFTADASVVCIPNGIPKTGDVSVMAYALMAVIAAAGVMRKK